VPEVRTALAAFISDIHLSDTPPVARAEEDWHKVQFGYLEQVRDVCQEYRVPLVIAGDINDRWKLSPETVNRAITVFKTFPLGVYAVPGQHDLPFHRHEDIEKSSYWTYVQAGVIHDLDADFPIYLQEKVGCEIVLYGFPWGSVVSKLRKEYREEWPDAKHVAVIHAYCWQEGHTYLGAPEDKWAPKWVEKLDGYNAAVFGDNHLEFTTRFSAVKPPRKKFWVHNCGTLIRRRADEIGTAPSVGILWDNGSITREYLDVSKDKFADKAEELTTGKLDAEAFLEVLGGLEEVGLDFAEAVRRFLNRNPKIGDTVRKLILKSLEGGK
jgi:hypothetical protein